MNPPKVSLEQIKFYLGVLVSIPIFPILYAQGMRIKRNFYHFSEAIDNQGEIGHEYPDKLKLVGLGESTLAAVGIPSQNQAFIGHFSQHLSHVLSRHIQWKVYAKSGYTARMTLEEQVPAITEEHVDLFVIALGGNDTFQCNSPHKWANDIHEVILSLRKRFPQTPILCTTMPPVHTFIAFTPLMRISLGQLIRLHSDALEKVASSFEQVYYDSRKIDLKEWLNTHSSYKKENFFL